MMGYHEAANDFRNVINQDYAKKYREADEREIETENQASLEKYAEISPSP